jgi:heat shock protein HslJ
LISDASIPPQTIHNNGVRAPRHNTHLYDDAALTLRVAPGEAAARALAAAGPTDADAVRAHLDAGRLTWRSRVAGLIRTPGSGGTKQASPPSNGEQRTYWRKKPGDMTDQALRRALATAWIVLAALALAACGSVAPARSASPGFTGYDWKVVAIGHDGKVTPIPAQVGVGLQFSPGGQFGAGDGINFYSGTYRATTDSFTLGTLAATANGYAGHDPAILAGMSAIGSLDDSARATVRLTGDQLVVHAGSYTLTCHRAGAQADPTPAPTTTG